MPVKIYSASASFTARVDAVCELCANPFSFTEEYSFNSPMDIFTGKSSKRDAEDYVLTHMRPVLEGLQAGNPQFLSIKPCPKCGYVQSWMVKNYQKKRYDLLMSLWILGFFAGMLVFGFLVADAPADSTLEMILVIAAGFFCLVGMAGLFVLARRLRSAMPNKKILAGREPPSRQNRPVIRIESLKS
jgi:hypothetical protein